MKWFKHYSNASTSAKLNILMDKYGADGYGKYWLLVELLADKWDGGEPRFQIHSSTIKQRLRVYHSKIAERFLEDIHQSRLMSVECTDDLYTIYFPKLLEIKDNHTRNLQVNSKLLAPREEKNREEKKRREKKVITSDFDLEKIYKNYPLKKGKAAGIEKLSSIIKDQDTYDIILQGAKNYSKEIEITGSTFIKHFSTWVNNNGWEDDYQTKSDEDEFAETIFAALENLQDID